MTAAVSELYAPMLERELEAIPAAVRLFRATHDSGELFQAVAQFAVLAYAPSQHARHALLATLSAYDLRAAAGESWDELLTACARYAAESRQPWSEPPLLDPPPPAEVQRGDLEELQAAVAGRDRPRAERWLAFRLTTSGLRDDLASVAASDQSDFGHKLIVTAAAWRLADTLGEKGRYAALRTAVWELVAYQGNETMPDAPLPELIARCIEEKGSIESAHAAFLFDAKEMLRGGTRVVPGAKPPVYALARDYGQYLKAHAVASRLRAAYPAARWDEFIDACRINLEQGPSFAEWSFA